MLMLEGGGSEPRGVNYVALYNLSLARLKFVGREGVHIRKKREGLHLLPGIN